MQTSQEISEEFTEGEGWICPDVESITLDNNSFLDATGHSTNFVMVVNDCATAK